MILNRSPRCNHTIYHKWDKLKSLLQAGQVIATNAFGDEGVIVMNAFCPELLKIVKVSSVAFQLRDVTCVVRDARSIARVQYVLEHCLKKDVLF
jgi:hypothetical protein